MIASSPVIPMVIATGSLIEEEYRKTLAVTRYCARFSAVPGAIPGIFKYSRDMELIFEIRDAEEGGYSARALGHSIFTEGDTWEELRANVLEAVSLHFEGEATQPRMIQLHYVKDELIPFEAA